MAEKSRVPWLSIVLTGLLAFVISMAVIAAVMAGYAFGLVMQAHGAPDPNSIAAFANRVIPFLGPLLLSLLVLFAARRVVRRAKSRQALAWRAGWSCGSPAYIDVYAPSRFG
jgi:hypothetical protein